MSFSYTTLSVYIFLLISTLIHSSNGSFTEDLVEVITLARAEKTTLLHFYFHDIVSGKNPTVVHVAGEAGGFGSTFIIDDALTQGPEPDSMVIGRAQGMYSSAAQNDLTLLMVVTFAFTGGEHNGSSISILGRNRVLDEVREMPVVGGSGVFRLARGGMHWHIQFSSTSRQKNAIVEYNVTVKHLSEN